MTFMKPPSYYSTRNFAFGGKKYRRHLCQCYISPKRKRLPHSGIHRLLMVSGMQCNEIPRLKSVIFMVLVLARGRSYLRLLQRALSIALSF